MNERNEKENKIKMILKKRKEVKRKEKEREKKHLCLFKQRGLCNDGSVHQIKTQ
jgi:hypothetical protein